MTTSFNFTSMSNKYIYSVNSKIILHIKTVNNSTACLYFTDELHNKINIPDSIMIYTYDFQNLKNKVIQPRTQNNDYILCWTENYDIEFNGENLLTIKNQRSWNITYN